MAKKRVIRTGGEGINLFDLLPPQQPGTSSRIKSRRGMPIMFEPPTTEAQSLLANMEQQQNMLGLVDKPMVDTSMPSEGLMQNVSSTPNIFDIDNEEEIEEEIELKKQTKFGDAMARIGGGTTLSEEQRKGLSPTAREKYNQERLSARNKGIAEMLFVLSDALAGRDILGRSMERQKARLPKEKSASKIRDELIRKIQSGAKLSADELVTLQVIDPPLAERLQFDPSLRESIANAIPPQSNIPTITTKEQFDNLPSGASFYYNGNLEEKEWNYGNQIFWWIRNIKIN